MKLDSKPGQSVAYPNESAHTKPRRAFFTFDNQELSDPAIRAQLIVAITAIGVPLLILSVNVLRAKWAKRTRRETVEQALQWEAGYLVALYEEAWGFWNPNETRFAFHMLSAFYIELPPLLSTPQTWVEILSTEKQPKYSKLITDIHHYNQILKELEMVRSDESKARNRDRCWSKFRDIGDQLRDLGFNLQPWTPDDKDNFRVLT